MEAISLLKDKRIVLAVTGSIAVYKTVDLASKLTQAGALVDVIMTGAAQQFVAPVTFQAVTGRPVYSNMWQADSSGGLPTHIAHVGLGEGADLLAVVPTTANTLAKLAQGLADDLLTVTALAARCPLLIAPAMDGGMYEHPATQANVKTLIERSATLVEPDEGRFASGLSGRGRLPDTATLIGHIRRVLGQYGPLAGKRVVVTAGPSIEPLDPVRFLSNRSSGKQGHALAQAAIDAGADVTLISSVDMPVPVGAKWVRYQQAVELLQAVQHEIVHPSPCDVLIMAAAVADFRPASQSEQKIKKHADGSAPTLDLARNPDILMAVRDQREADEALKSLLVVGFAAESQHLLENAQGKLERKRLDLIVANDITASDAGFAAETNRVTILDRSGQHDVLALRSKALVSEHVMARIAMLSRRRD